jgi:hypothetical protein
LTASAICTAKAQPSRLGFFWFWTAKSIPRAALIHFPGILRTLLQKDEDDGRSSSEEIEFVKSSSGFQEFAPRQIPRNFRYPLGG